MRSSCWLSLLILVSAACAAPPASSHIDAQVDELFAEFGADSPGAAVLVIRDGEVLYRNGFGQANVEHGIRVTPSTVFDIASVSKQFAGMAIAMMVESGQIDLEDDIRSYLRDLPDFGPTITINHLVHHTSGIRDWPGTLAVAGWQMDDVISFDQILTMARNQQDLNFTPGAEYSYSNTGFNILAALVAEVSGLSFREWTDANIFQPLGMGDTHFHDNHAEVVENRARGYARVDDGFQNINNGLTALGSSSLQTTVDDLAKWMANFDDGRVGGIPVIERMQQRGVLNDGEQISYAFGQSVGEYRGLTTWAHTGSWAGFRTVLLRVPEHRFGVVILSNVGDYNPMLTARAVADIYLRDEMEPRGDPVEVVQQPAVSEAQSRSAAQLNMYAGEFYSDELDTSYWVEVKNDKLVAHHRRHGDIELTPVGPDEFRSSLWFIPILEFDRDPRGEVIGFRITQGRSRNMRFERQFDR